MKSLLTFLSVLILLAVDLLQAQDHSPIPATMLLPESALPEYEKEIDHAGYISMDVDRGVLTRGNLTYQNICYNCHGDLALPGSIPDSLRFSEEQFKHGNDPYTMYLSTTRGWGKMAPLVQLTPKEKYEVIHFIREKYIKPNNPGQYFEVTKDYLEGLPKGTSRGPKPVKREPWKDFHYGSFIMKSLELVGPDTLPQPRFTAEQIAWERAGNPRADTLSPNANIAYKGIAMRLDEGEGGMPKGKAFTLFEHDTLRLVGAWIGEGFIDWNEIQLDGTHEAHAKSVGEAQFELLDGPGWANPKNGKFTDPRFIGKDGRRFGPLPDSWAKYLGLYQYGNRQVISYRIGDTKILESHRFIDSGSKPVFSRILNIGKSSSDLITRIAKSGIGITTTSTQVNQGKEGNILTLEIPAEATPLNIEIFLAKEMSGKLEELAAHINPEDLTPLTKGGPSRWPQVLETPIIKSPTSGGFTWDKLSRPLVNPWNSQLRATGVDFSPDGNSAYIPCWDGEVWRVDGIAENKDTVTWHRIAEGLYQPLGVKLVDGNIYLTCRDQLVILRDFNGDGETDFYEAFNTDQQTTEHFHEFAMGLQIDEEGNFYYAKSARHAKDSLVEQHGTLIKVSPDGSQSEIIAHGFRAANGVCINPDGTFIVTDQEGHWNPMNRINWVKPGNRFYGNMYGYGAPEDTSDSAMEQPLVWIAEGFDRSPAELLWVESESWGPLNGSLLNLSYGHGRLEILPFEVINGQHQGGMVRLPIPDLPTGIMRGRFHPNGDLFVCGMSAWGTNQMDLPGALYRIRATGKPVHLPTDLKAYDTGLEITFSDPLNTKSAEIAENYSLSTWDLKRSSKYGSIHYNKKYPNVSSARLSEDRKTLFLAIPGIEPVWQMLLEYELEGSKGEPVSGILQNTIYNLRESGRK